MNKLIISFCLRLFLLQIISHTLHLFPQLWHTASVWVLVFVLVLLFVTAGIISISPQVQIASNIHIAQPKQPLCLVLVVVSVIAWTVTYSEPHLGHLMKKFPLRACSVSFYARLFGNLLPLTALKILAIREYACGFLPCHRQNLTKNPHIKRY